MVKADDVILGGAAKAFAKRIGLPERDVQMARSGPVSDLGGLEFLIILGTLPDGRSIRLKCRHGLPHYVVTFRPL